MSTLLAIAASVILLWTYAGAVRRLLRRGVDWPWRRSAAFTAGVVLAAATSSAPVPDRFSGRVLEHLLLGMLAPGLLVLGRPISLALRARSHVSRQVRIALRSGTIARLSHPLVAAAIFSIGPWLLWLTPLYELEGRSDAVHQLVHLHLLSAGVLLAVAVLGGEPTPWRSAHALRMWAAALLLPLHTLLGMVLIAASSPWLNDGLPAGPALDDQRLGAAILWIAGDGLATVMLLGVGAQWARRERSSATRGSPSNGLAREAPNLSPSSAG